MAPFPESESMTIKRLEVAIRKKDMHLLKDGAYKLHEKFHTGHRFEFIPELERILEYVRGGNVPLEISEILAPTIEEIIQANHTEIAQSLQSADIQVNNEENVESVELSDINLSQLAQNSAREGVLNVQYIETNEAEPPIQESEPQIKEEDIRLQGEAYENYMAQQAAEHTANQASQAVVQNTSYQPVQNSVDDTPAPIEQNRLQPSLKPRYGTDNVVLFYDDKSVDIDYTLIKDYRNRLNNLFSSRNQEGDYNLLKEIAALNNVVDTKILDLESILSVLKMSKSRVSFVTTSQSQDITRIFAQKGVDFEIPYVKKLQSQQNSQCEPFSFIPMLGLSNIFVCSSCNLRSLKTDFSSKTLSVQCPNCDSAAFPDLYAINSYNPDCNPVFWHRAFSAFVKSNIWVILNPPLDENKEIVFDFIKTVSECSKPDIIYLFSKESDKREFYRNMFLKLLPDTQLRSNFVNVEQLCEEYIRAKNPGHAQ